MKGARVRVIAPGTIFDGLTGHVDRTTDDPKGVSVRVVFDRKPIECAQAGNWFVAGQYEFLRSGASAASSARVG